VTLSNPNTYATPITNIVIQASSSDGMSYSTTAECGSGSPSTTVPLNPQPYSYGTATCRYRLALDRRVFGSAGFPGGSSSSSNGRRLLGGYGYFPPPNQRATWTVTAIATVSLSSAQCLSSPTPVNTNSWWTWLEGWFHHPRGGIGSSNGRNLLHSNTAAIVYKATAGEAHSAPQAIHKASTDSRVLMASASAAAGHNTAVTNRRLQSTGNCNGLITPTGYTQRNVDGSYAVIGQVTLHNPGPVPLSVSSIKVTVGNTIAFRPLFTDADCHGATAVAAFSSTTCSYAVGLPSEGKSAVPAVWSGVVAAAKVGNGVDCASDVVTLINMTG